MSYTLAFWALSVGKLAERVRPDTRSPGPASDEQAETVIAAIQELGRPLGAVDHSSSGGHWFREEVMAGPVADALGEELAGNLLSRPLNGVGWPGYPSVGWATNAELRAALAVLDDRIEDVAEQVEGDEAEILATIVSAVRFAATAGDDLVTLYS